MRLFVAVDVADGVKDAIERSVVDPLRGVLEGARWTRPEGRHLTLAFLGETADDVVDALGTALDDAARRHAPFDAAFGEIGGFPNIRRPRVLWVGLRTGAEQLAALASDVATTLAPFGYEPEPRPFRAHYTLARFPSPRVVEVGDVRVPGEAFAIEEVVLYRSQLHPKGARYTPLHRARLSRPA